MSTTALPLESKLLLEMTRGAALAVHAAAGSARGHQAARLLRAAEGLCRSAAALLQLPDDAKTSETKAQKETDTKTCKPNEKTQPTPEKDANRKKQGTRPRRRRRAPASLQAVPNGDVELDDAWADSASVPPAPPPQAAEAAAKRRRSAPARTPAPRALAERLPTPPTLPAPTWQGGPPSAGAASAGPPLALHEGGDAYATGLQGRPELNHEVLHLESFDRAAGRWVCVYGDGAKLLLRPSNLVPIPDDLDED